MSRRVFTILAVVIATLAIASGLPAATSGVAILAQEASTEAELETDTPTTFNVEHLSLGERYETPLFDLEIQDAFVAPSVDGVGYSKVRAAVAFRQLSDVPVPYEWAGMTGMVGYPELRVVDEDGEIWSITVRDPAQALLPGSNLVSLEPYVPGHWTVGFQVPTAQASELTIEALWNGELIADWDVFSNPVPLTGWDAPPNAAVLSSSDTIVEWNGSVISDIGVHGTGACATNDASAETSFALFFELSTNDSLDGLFPDVRAPNPVAIAIWEDGASARMRIDGIASLVGDETVVANALSPEQIVIPPGVTLLGVGIFDVVRDQRFADLLEQPISVIFYPTEEQPVWYDVVGAGTVDITDGLCEFATGGLVFDVLP